MSKGDIPCPHGRIRCQCVPCGGSRICPHKKYLYQCWHCDPRGWADHCIRRAKSDAKRRNHAGPEINPEELVNLRRKSDTCFFCEQTLSWSNPKNSPHLHHDHDTGEVFGYAHPVCNNIEGYIKSLGPSAAVKFLRNMLRKVCADSTAQ
jgi:hypothetical protein